MFPFSSMSMPSAAGIFGRPGIVIILPVIATMKPAPAFRIISLTVILNGSSHCRFFGSSENEYCVFAIQIGKFPKPKSFICFGDRVSLGVPKCPGIHYIDQAGLELEAIPHGMLGGWPPR